jgi:two-component system, NarL family, sensor histidine kinase DegS
MADEAAPRAADLDGLVRRLEEDLATLDRELGEVDLLVTQAKAEATRHETRRASAAEKLEGLPKDEGGKERIELATSLVTLTKRAALMESQVDVLEGKRRALQRYRDGVAAYLDTLHAIEGGGAQTGDPDATATSAAGDGPALPPAVSRLVLGAQEDLRREIARAMHDGPAQSLTNIVLQAQIVQRLVEKDPSSAGSEVRQLTAMVQQTLDATKSFIFDVRPMVLDDLGLVPTLRRAARERGRRAGVDVDFESMGQDRRLPMDLESGLFRILDEALAAYLGQSPDRLTLRLDWGEQLEARIHATRAQAEPRRRRGAAAVPTAPAGADLPPALAAMIEDRIADEREAVEEARRASIVALPGTTWRDIQSRAASAGVTVELLEEGGELRVLAELPPAGDAE